MGVKVPCRVAKGVIDIRAVVLESRQLDPFTCSNPHWYAGQSHIHIALDKIPLVAAGLDRQTFRLSG